MIFLPDVLSTLSFLRGETSPPSSQTPVRTEFIQRTLEEIYEAADWKFAQISAIVSAVSGVATLPSGLDIRHQLSLQYQTTPGDSNTDVEMNQINVNDRYGAQVGQNLYWLTTNTDGTFSVNTKEAVSSVKFVGYSYAPILSATLGTPFPDRMTIALGANRWVQQAQNPQSDLSQLEDLYQNRLGDNIGAYGRNTVNRGMRSIMDEAGYHTGDF